MRVGVADHRGGRDGATHAAEDAGRLVGRPAYRAGFGPFTPGFVTIPFGDAAALEDEVAALTPSQSDRHRGVRDEEVVFREVVSFGAGHLRLARDLNIVRFGRFWRIMADAVVPSAELEVRREKCATRLSALSYVLLKITMFITPSCNSA